MQKLFFKIFIAFMVISNTTAAQVTFPFQSIIRNSTGNPLVNAQVELSFLIHDSTENGPVIWQELQSLESNSFGIVTARVGAVNNLLNINWFDNSKFFEVQANAGYGFVSVGNTELLPVPYSLSSLFSESANNGIDRISSIGDTLFFKNGQNIIIPGISASNAQNPHFQND
jgi:hypothetical protein